MDQATKFNIVRQAFCLTERVGDFREHARSFFYEVTLSDHACPGCGGGLEMLGEGQCCCCDCGKRYDPTIVFQYCPVCSGSVVLRIRRYVCKTCGADVPSRFLFEGLVFDAEYFSEKMQDYRQRKEEQREQIRQMLAATRSLPIDPVSGYLGSIPGLVEALNGLTLDLGVLQRFIPKEGFDLNRYQSHIQAHLGNDPISLEEIPPLSENRRYDRIGRFIAMLFLDQARIVDIWQEGPIIWVIKHGNRKRQDIFRGTENGDGCEGLVG